MNNVDEIIQPHEIAKKSRFLNCQELLSLLKSGNINIFFSWGGHAFRRIEIANETRGFRMMVQGRHHYGHVYIFVNGLDLFDVYFTNPKGKIKKIKTGLYFDMLQTAIDNFVEKK